MFAQFQHQNSTATKDAFLFLLITCLSVHTGTFTVNCKLEFWEAHGGRGGKRDAALPLPPEHTVRHALHTTWWRQVAVQPLLYEHCGRTWPWVYSKISTDVNYNMIKDKMSFCLWRLVTYDSEFCLWSTQMKLLLSMSDPPLELFHPYVSFHRYGKYADISQAVQDEEGERVTP